MTKIRDWFWYKRYPVEPSVLEPNLGRVGANGLFAGDLVTLGSDGLWHKASFDAPIGVMGFYDGAGRVLTSGEMSILTDGGKEQD